MAEEIPERKQKYTSISVNEISRQENVIDGLSDDENLASKANIQSGLRVGSLLRIWAEVSRINYFSAQPLDIITLGLSGQSIRRRSIGLAVKDYSLESFVPSELRHKSLEDLFAEQFPIKVTTLLNEDQLWGSFYTFPELYADVYSPVVRIRDVKDVLDLVDGVLTRDMVTACLSYLKRTPILGDYVYIKLDLTSKQLKNIQVLQHYKYLVYLDLSSNFLTDLSVLSHLLYLQYLSVSFNRLNTVLEYETPQWFLTEVHYKFNSVKRIRDLHMFWSITILDLSHNNIKGISGLETLKYLRRLDLSFNHIQRLENLNNLRLLWLDVSYNNISSFEFGTQVGLWTLLHLEYLNLNENNLTSMKMFSGCTRLLELHVRNNRLSMLLELAVYMRQMRRLIILDLRANPICSSSGYKDVVINTFPILLSLDAEELDPVEQRTAKMDMAPHVATFATRRLLRLMYVEQLSRARVSPAVPPADTTDVPLVVLVGYEAVGKGTLARRLATECAAHVELAISHTTAPYHFPGHYIEVTRGKFDEMLLSGEFLSYSEIEGESYGLSLVLHFTNKPPVLFDSRAEAFVNPGKVRLACTDLSGALMLKLRGLRPYLILASCSDKQALTKRQQLRKEMGNKAYSNQQSTDAHLERSTLQVLLSGRIIITGILNEILLSLPEENYQSEFVIDSQCSLMMDSNARQAMNDYAKGIKLLTRLHSISCSSSTVEDGKKGRQRYSQIEESLCSLYKESQDTGEYNSCANGQNSYQEKKLKKSFDGPQPHSKKETNSNVSCPKSVDFSRYASSTWKGMYLVPDSAKSSKSVTFTSADAENQELDPVGLLIEPQQTADKEAVEAKVMRSISTRMPFLNRGHYGDSIEDMDLWLAFLAGAGVTQSNEDTQMSDYTTHNTRVDDPDAMIRLMDNYIKITNTPCETFTTNIRDDYEGIHRKLPGLFWDTVTMDDPDEAFLKVKNIIRNIVNSQNLLKPMFDIDFANMEHYPTVKKSLKNICKQIAPQRLFY